MNERQKKIQDLITYFKSSLAEPTPGGLHTTFNLDVIHELEMLKNQYADNPALKFHRDAELITLGFHPPGTVGIAGCTTVPCFGGKMPDDNDSTSMCAIGQTMCDQSPRSVMRDAKAFAAAEADLKEKARVKRNFLARERYTAKKKAGQNKDNRIVIHRQNEGKY